MHVWGEIKESWAQDEATLPSFIFFFLHSVNFFHSSLPMLFFSISPSYYSVFILDNATTLVGLVAPHWKLVHHKKEIKNKTFVILLFSLQTLCLILIQKNFAVSLVLLFLEFSILNLQKTCLDNLAAKAYKQESF